MKKQDEAAKLRAELRQRVSGRGKRFDAELRGRVVAFAEQRRREGASWMAIATELGATFETIRRWCLRAAKKKAVRLRAVEIVAAPIVAAGEARKLSVLSPNGLRVEGVVLDEVVALIRALG